MRAICWKIFFWLTVIVLVVLVAMPSMKLSSEGVASSWEKKLMEQEYSNVYMQKFMQDYLIYRYVKFGEKDAEK